MAINRGVSEPPRESGARAARTSRLFQRPYLLLVCAALAWGGNVVASRMAVGEISPMLLAGARWLLVLVLLGLTCRRQIVEAAPTLLRHRYRVLGMGAIGFTGNSALSYLAAHHTSAVNLSIVQGTIPVLVLLGGLVFHRERIAAGQAIGVAASVAGCLVVSSRGRLETLSAFKPDAGVLIMLGACVSYASFTVMLRGQDSGRGNNAVGLLFGLATAGCITSLPLIGIEAAAGTLQLPSLKGWMILLYVALIASLLAQMFFIRSVALIGPSRAGLFINLVPAFGALLAVLLLGEAFGLYQAVALLFILLGIAIAEISRAR
ncbi:MULTISPECIES: DMT family transporter [unclassified Sphingomonas]|uniref:DMT family transporter n=1 Tax=unclassified Sphingomonas TaxID=196159 RepID=UPI00257F6E55|nr:MULTISPECIES: DMT family transporter [unclassified Sphingomonas]